MLPASGTPTSRNDRDEAVVEDISEDDDKPMTNRGCMVVLRDYLACATTLLMAIMLILSSPQLSRSP